MRPCSECRKARVQGLSPAPAKAARLAHSVARCKQARRRHRRGTVTSTASVLGPRAPHRRRHAREKTCWAVLRADDRLGNLRAQSAGDTHIPADARHTGTRQPGSAGVCGRFEADDRRTVVRPVGTGSTEVPSDPSQTWPSQGVPGGACPLDQDLRSDAVPLGRRCSGEVVFDSCRPRAATRWTNRTQQHAATVSQRAGSGCEA